MQIGRAQTGWEELANALSHGLGAALGVVATVVLVLVASAQADPYRIVAASIYGATLIALFGASTAYHSFRSPRLKAALQILDHAAIYLLIAGTYTPFTLVTLRGPWGFTLLSIVWAMALVGILFKLVVGTRWERLSTALYIVMGWIGVVAAGPLIERLDPRALAWLVGGGLTYTLGVLFFVRDHRPFHHALWHLFVLGGAACHFLAVVVYVL
jgi:hemolysin III